MKNAIIMSLAILGVVSFAGVGSAETYGRYLGVSYPNDGAGQVSRSTNNTFMEPAQTYGRYMGVTYVVPQQTGAAGSVAAYPEFKTIDRVAGQTVTTISGTVKSVNVAKGFFIAENKVTGQEKLIHVPDAQALSALQIGQSVQATLTGTSCMASVLK